MEKAGNIADCNRFPERIVVHKKRHTFVDNGYASMPNLVTKPPLRSESQQHTGKITQSHTCLMYSVQCSYSQCKVSVLNLEEIPSIPVIYENRKKYSFPYRELCTWDLKKKKKKFYYVPWEKLTCPLSSQNPGPTPRTSSISSMTTSNMGVLRICSFNSLHPTLSIL